MEHFDFTLNAWPCVLAVLLWGVSIERRLASIARDIAWIKKILEDSSLNSSLPK